MSPTVVQPGPTCLWRSTENEPSTSSAIFISPSPPPPYQLDRSPAAKEQLEALESDAGLFRRLKAVKKALGRLQLDPTTGV